MPSAGRLASGSVRPARFSFSCRGSRRSGGGGSFAVGMSAKYFSIHALVCVGCEVAGHDQDGVVRRVERLEERPHVVERRRVEVREVAVEVVGVVPVLVRRHRQVDPREAAVGLIEDVDLDLVLDDFLLVLQVLGVDVQPAHAVGLGPEDRLEHVRRHDLEVVREVEARRAVEQAAVRFDQADELHLAEVLRALEHHVLEEVREPGPVLRLVAEADVVVHGHDRRRRRRVARQHDLEAVRQLVVLDRDLEPLLRRGRLAGRTRDHGSRRSHDDRERDHHQALREASSYQHRCTPSTAAHIRHKYRHGRRNADLCTHGTQITRISHG